MDLLWFSPARTELAKDATLDAGLLRHEGLSVGGSAGLNVAAAIQVARNLGAGLNLPAGAGAVALAIGQVVELVGPDRAQFLGQPPRAVNVVSGVAERRRRHEAEVGADHAQDIDLLLALRFWHDNDAAVAAGVGDQGEANAGAVRGVFDDEATGPEMASSNPATALLRR